jgi:hypothetical protein
VEILPWDLELELAGEVLPESELSIAAIQKEYTRYVLARVAGGDSEATLFLPDRRNRRGPRRSMWRPA